MRHEDPHRDEVWLTEVVDEAADVAIETGVDAVHLPVLEQKGASPIRGGRGQWCYCYSFK